MSERIPRPYMDSAWFELLETAVVAHPRKRAGVADDIGISRSAISQIMSGTYGVSDDRSDGCAPDKIARAVLDHYDRPNCVLMDRVIDRSLCRRVSLIPEPKGGDARARWLTCQTCPHKPAPQNKE